MWAFCGDDGGAKRGKALCYINLNANRYKDPQMNATPFLLVTSKENKVVLAHKGIVEDLDGFILKLQELTGL